MARRDLSSSKLSGATSLSGSADRDPMGSLGNLMDVMLVFACGLLLALIANWNVDISKQQQDPSGLKEIAGDLEVVEEGISQDGGGYAEVGTVYRDEETGTLYVVAEEGVTLE